MNIHLTAEEKTLTVALEGRLDTVTSPELDRTLESVLEGVEELVLELADLEYVSSAGLRVILKLQKHMAKQGTLKVRHVNPTVMEVLEITGFADILTLE